MDKKKEEDGGVPAKRVKDEEWYQSMLEEMKATITEAVFTSRWVIIEAKWRLGDLIIKNKERFEGAGVKDSEIPEVITKSLKEATEKEEKRTHLPSKREIYRCVRFRKEYPDLSKLPGGKNISWHKIANRLLPGKELECPHDNLEKVEVWKCKDCNQTFVNKPK